jgi:hypothetical protein
MKPTLLEIATWRDGRHLNTDLRKALRASTLATLSTGFAHEAGPQSGVAEVVHASLRVRGGA